MQLFAQFLSFLGFFFVLFLQAPGVVGEWKMRILKKGRSALELGRIFALVNYLS